MIRFLSTHLCHPRYALLQSNLRAFSLLFLTRSEPPRRVRRVRRSWSSLRGERWAGKRSHHPVFWPHTTSLIRDFHGEQLQRAITVLTYLNDVSKGGATAFPRLNVQVRPRKGMALVFFPATVDGHVDGNALHEACPAVDVKYVSQVWIRQGVYEGSPNQRLTQKMVPGLQAARDEMLRREARWDELASARRQAEHSRMNPQVFAPPSFVQAAHAGC